MRRVLPALAVLTVGLLAACGGGGVASPSPSGSGLTVDVLPAESPVEVRAAIPGERTNFLVVASDAAVITATASHATVDAVVPAQAARGQVVEVWLTIDPAITEDSTASVDIAVTHGQATRTIVRSIAVHPMSSEGRARDAQVHFDFWTAWLAAQHPELGIGAGTAWDPVYVSTLLVVSHMSYYSLGWEMGLAWHAGTIPPYDWSEIYLRRRGSESAPSVAFRVDSFSGATPPRQVSPPGVVVR